MFVVILAQSAATSRAYAAKYEEEFSEATDLAGLAAANAAAAFTGTFVVNGSPTKAQIVDSAGGRSQLSPLTAAAVVLVVLVGADRAAGLPARRRPGRGGLPDRGRAHRRGRDAAHPGHQETRVRRGPAHHGRGGGPGRRVRHHPRHRRLDRRPPAAQLQPAQQRPGEVGGRALAAGPGRAGRADRGGAGGLPVRHQPVLRQRGQARRGHRDAGRPRRPAALAGPRLRRHRRRRLHRVHGPDQGGRAPAPAADPPGDQLRPRTRAAPARPLRHQRRRLLRHPR